MQVHICLNQLDKGKVLKNALKLHTCIIHKWSRRQIGGKNRQFTTLTTRYYVCVTSAHVKSIAFSLLLSLYSQIMRIIFCILAHKYHFSEFIIKYMDSSYRARQPHNATYTTYTIVLKIICACTPAVWHNHHLIVVLLNITFLRLNFLIKFRLIACLSGRRSPLAFRVFPGPGNFLTLCRDRPCICTFHTCRYYYFATTQRPQVQWWAACHLETWWNTTRLVSSLKKRVTSYLIWLG